MANETPSTGSGPAAPAGNATKQQITDAMSEAEGIVTAIIALHDKLNVGDTKFIAVTVGVAAQRLQEAQRYLRNKLAAAK